MVEIGLDGWNLENHAFGAKTMLFSPFGSKTASFWSTKALFLKLKI